MNIAKLIVSLVLFIIKIASEDKSSGIPLSPESIEICNLGVKHLKKVFKR